MSAPPRPGKGTRGLAGKPMGWPVLQPPQTMSYRSSKATEILDHSRVKSTSQKELGMPFIEQTPCLTKNSFPSGHRASAFPAQQMSPLQAVCVSTSLSERKGFPLTSWVCTLLHRLGLERVWRSCRVLGSPVSQVGVTPAPRVPGVSPYAVAGKILSCLLLGSWKECASVKKTCM